MDGNAKSRPAKSGDRELDVDVVDQLIREWKRERPELSADAMAIVGRVLMLAKYFENSANTALAPHDLAQWSLDVLATLRRSGEPYRLRPTQLRRSVLLSSGAMTNRLDRLESAGYLVRSLGGDSDRRAVGIELTKEGVKKIDNAIQIRFEVADENVEGLTDAEKKTHARLLSHSKIGFEAQIGSGWHLAAFGRPPPSRTVGLPACSIARFVC